MIDFIRKKLKVCKPIYGFFGLIFFYIQFIYIKFFSFIFSLCPIKNNKIVFVSYYGRGYGDSGKYICEKLLKGEKKYTLIWAYKSAKDRNSIPKDIVCVKFNSIKYLYHLSTSKIWINNTRFMYGTRKRKMQKYIQLWHGGIAMKKIEYESNLPKKYLKTMKNDNKMIDFMISNGKYCTNMYKRAFRYTGIIEEYGTPRNDYLINNKDNAYISIRDKYKLSKNTKILLYGPTFRTNYDNNPYDVNFDEIKNWLEKETGNKWVIMIRMHSVAQDYDFTNNSKINNNAINVTDYPDMQELISACDLLITDYSSIMFEGMLIDKPVLLYAKDIEEYENDRGLYFKFSDLPFELCKDKNFIKKSIAKAIDEKYIKNYKKFKDNVGIFEDGRASDRVCELIDRILVEDNNE